MECSSVYNRNSTVKLVFSGHPREIAKWLLNTGWPSDTGCKKNSSNTIIAEKSFDFKLETFISGILMICEKKLETVWTTHWPLNTGEHSRKSRVTWWPRPLNGGQN